MYVSLCVLVCMYARVCVSVYVRFMSVGSQ